MDYNFRSVINLLTSKIFHDIANIASLLNFTVELNRDNPSCLDFNELIDINKRSLVSINVLKYAFLPGEYSEKALEDIKLYFGWRKNNVEFEIDHSSFSQDYLIIIVHVLMLLVKIAYMGTKTLIRCHGALYITCKSVEKIDKNKLAIFDNLSAQDNVHIYYLNGILKKLNLEFSYRLVAGSDIDIECKQQH